MTFRKVLNDLKPGVFFIQETKLKDTGKLKFDDYIVFEKVRQNRDGGGGLALGALKQLHPVWVKEGDNQVETLSINISIQNLKIRCCVAYGCQESDSNEKKEEFWKYLDDEVEEARKSSSGLVIQFDGNLWAGKNLIQNDPRPQNRNGKLFEQFLRRNSNLTVVNSMKLCQGLITRRRIKAGKLEESILDFFVVCDTVMPHITKMVIDEEGKHVLTNYENVKHGGKASNSDHATQYVDLNLKIINNKPQRREIWNLKNKEAQKSFQKETSNTLDFTNCFSNKLPVLTQIENWRKVLVRNIKKSFKKIRINGKKPKPLSPLLSELIDKRNKLMRHGVINEQIEELDKDISRKEAEINFKLIKENFGRYKDDPEKINLKEVWKTLEKCWPKSGPNLPSAKLNHVGKMVSDPIELKALLVKEYTERLRMRPLRPDLKTIEKRKLKLFEIKLKLAEKNQSKKWNITDLEAALEDLKKNKTRDNDGLINEIFKKDVIGKNLKESLLLLFNKMKHEKLIPSFMNVANITTIPKKGSKISLENERGIFRLSVIRNILMRLIYNDKYDVIDNSMSDSQMGARKKKGCRNNIFIVNGIIHDIMSSKSKEPVLLQIYDYKQMFDAINLREAISDIYDAGVDDDHLSLLYQANNDVKMSVSTSSGLSERQTIQDVVLQGDTWGSILASVQVDSIAKEVEKSGVGFKYMNTLPIPMLGLVDDVIGITAADHRAQQLNSILKVKTAEKRLQFGVKKCKTMLVEKGTRHQSTVVDKCATLSVDEWNVSHKHSNVTGENILIENYMGETNMQNTNSCKYLGFVLSDKGDNTVNIHAMRNKSIWIIRKIITRLDTLHLQNYYFECAIIFLNVFLRSSILYACETYYNLSETQIRLLERIEEGFLRKIFHTTTGCPISQLYLEAGHVPARFAIKKARLLFLKTILEEKENSTIKKFLMLQFENPSKGDWASSSMQDLKDLGIDLTLEEIRTMSKYTYKELIKKSIQGKALEYLITKRRSKGQEIKYTELKMAEYLTPGCENLTISEQRNIFAIRNRMVDIPVNFTKEQNSEKCTCGCLENMKHIYECKLWNQEENIEIEYEEIFNENILKQLKVSKIFYRNLQKREEHKMKNEQDNLSHVIQFCDPLASSIEGSAMDCK